jgi:hypothetical protein
MAAMSPIMEIVFHDGGKWGTLEQIDSFPSSNVGNRLTDNWFDEILR